MGFTHVIKKDSEKLKSKEIKEYETEKKIKPKLRTKKKK